MGDGTKRKVEYLPPAPPKRMNFWIENYPPSRNFSENSSVLEEVGFPYTERSHSLWPFNNKRNTTAIGTQNFASINVTTSDIFNMT